MVCSTDTVISSGTKRTSSRNQHRAVSATLDCGIFGTPSAKFRRPIAFGAPNTPKSEKFGGATHFPSGPAFALFACEYHVLRAAVLSIVLTLANGQDVALLCRVLCDPVHTTTSECQHQDVGSRTVTARAECRHASIADVVLVQEDHVRSISDHGVRHAIVAFRNVIPALKDAMHEGDEPGRAPSSEFRPLITALRI
jgi:hypothetical protein